jgi:Ras-related protein Rab-21
MRPAYLLIDLGALIVYDITD